MKSSPQKKYLFIFVTVSLVALGIYFFRPFKIRMVGFVTDLSARTLIQKQNILRAADSLSGVVLESGQVFSFNEQVGPYTEEKGYKPERSFVNKGVQNTSGGGVCQVASTLYNAVKKAGFEILERVPHSQEVESVGPGMDATLAYGVADLKFKNSYPFPIKIVSNISKDQLKIEIWGKRSSPSLWEKGARL